MAFSFRMEWATLVAAFLAATALCVAGSAAAQTSSDSDAYITPPPADYGAGTAAAGYSTSGQFALTTTDLSIGPKGGLVLERHVIGAQWRSNWIGTITTDPNNPSGHTVSIGAHSELFGCPNSTSISVCTPGQLSGSTLTYDPNTRLYTYTLKDGTTNTFDCNVYTSTYSTTRGGSGNDAQLTKIVKPNGEVITLTYLSMSFSELNYFGTRSRLQSVVSSRGYMLHFNYLAENVTNGNAQFSVLSQAMAINLAFDYCDPGVTTCVGLKNTWPTVIYGSDGSVTDPLNYVTRYSYGSNGIHAVTGIQLPGSTSDDVILSYQPIQGTTTSMLMSIKDGSGIYTNAYSNDQSGNAIVTQTDPLGHKKSMATSTDWFKVYSIDGNSNQTNWTEYNAAYQTGAPGSVTYPEGNSESYQYDGRGNVTQTTRTPKPGSGLSPVNTYASFDATCNNPKTCNEPNTTTDEFGNVTHYTYDPNTGFVLIKTLPADTNGNHPEIRYHYDAIPTYALNASGVLVQTGSITELTSTSQCATTNSADSSECIGTSDEVVTTYGYANNNGNNYGGFLTSITEGAGSGAWALNLTSNFFYDVIGNLSASADPRSNCTVYKYDADRRKTLETRSNGCGSPLLNETQYGYDQRGRLTSVSRATEFDASNNVMSWETTLNYYKSPTGKLSSTVDPLNNTTSYSYDPDDRLSTVTDPALDVTQYQYDDADQKTQEQRAVGTAIQQNYATYTYWPNGKLKSEADARGNAINYTYDGFDRLFQTTYADGAWGYNLYDAKGELTISTNRAGLSQIRCYDALGRMIAQKSVTNASNSGTCPTGGSANQSTYWYDFADRSFTYDLLGRVRSANSASGWNRSYTYDSAGRFHTLADNFGTFTYGHDAAGNLASIQYPSGDVVAYHYDNLDRMDTAALNGSTVATFGWDALSRRTSLTYGDGSSVSYGYDADDRLNAMSHTYPSYPAGNVSYTFGYDAAGRLKSKTSSNSAYTFTTPVIAQSYATADALNHYPSINGAARNYTNAGQLFQDWVLSRYYDQSGALSYAQSNTDYENLTSDALGATFSRAHNTPNPVPGYPSGVNSVVYTSYGPERPEVTYDSTYTGPYNQATSTYVGYRIYVLGPDPDERVGFRDTNGTWYYPHADRQGSTIALSQGAQPLPILSYDAYGQPGQTGGQTATDIAPGPWAYPYRYTGQRYDPFLNAYDYKARFYSAGDGRFWQMDPIGTADDENLFAYTHNSPLNGSDPFGLACTDIYETGSVDADGGFTLTAHGPCDGVTGGGSNDGGTLGGRNASNTADRSTSPNSGGCYKGRSTQITVALGGTILLGRGGGGSISATVSIPDDIFAIGQYRLGASLQTQSLKGAGAFVGWGTQGSIGRSVGPQPTGPMHDTGWYNESDAGWGPAGGISAQGHGNGPDDDVSSVGAAFGKLGAGFGALIDGWGKYDAASYMGGVQNKC